MKITFAGASDVGKVRHHNEDSYAIDPERNLMLVCDGMGGHAAGEVASRIGIETVTKFFSENDLKIFEAESFRYPETITSLGKLLAGAIAVANQRIIEHGRSVPGQTGMGTTVVACHFDNGVVSICHVGDSRAYLIREQNIRRVTVDHSWVSELMEKHNLTEEEAEMQVNKNVITRALGTKPQIRVDISQIRFIKGDLFLICSDGLTGMVSDGDILKASNQHGEDLDALVNDLIERANAAGGVDNVTVCAARIADLEKEQEFDEIRRITIDWGEEREVNELSRIATDNFPSADKPKVEAQAAAETGEFTTPVSKKKRAISPLFFILIILVIVVILAFWYSN